MQSSWKSLLRGIVNWLWSSDACLTSHQAVNEIYNMMLVLLATPHLDRWNLPDAYRAPALYQCIHEDKTGGRFWDRLCTFYSAVQRHPKDRALLGASATGQGIEGITHFRAVHAPLAAELFLRLLPMFYELETWRAFGPRELATSDPIGTLYMEMISNGYAAGTNRDIGSYFTPRWLTHEVVSHLDPRWNMRCTDLACGSGGFLSAMALHVLRRLDEEVARATCTQEEADRRWAHFVRENLWGADISVDVFKPLGIHLLAHGLLDAFPHMECCNRLLVSRPNMDVDAFDCICINPPFGKKTKETPLVYLTEQRQLRPTSEGGAESYWSWVLTADKKTIQPRCGLQFVMAQYRMLRTGGRGAFVIDTSFLSSREAKRLRQGLTESTTVTDVYVHPAGTFAHTGIETCTVLFSKVPPPPDHRIRLWRGVLDDRQERVVYPTAPIEVPIEQVLRKGASWVWSDYLSLPPRTLLAEHVYPLKELVCFQHGTRIVKKDHSPVATTACPIPVYGGGEIAFYTHTANRPPAGHAWSIVLARFGVSETCVRRVMGPFWLLDSGTTVISKDETVLLQEYLYLMLRQREVQLYQCALGAAQKNMKWDRVEQMLIPVPSLEEQRREITLFQAVGECHRDADRVTERLQAWIRQRGERSTPHDLRAWTSCMQAIDHSLNELERLHQEL